MEGESGMILRADSANSTRARAQVSQLGPAPISALHLLFELADDDTRKFKPSIMPELSPERRVSTRRLRQVFWDTSDFKIGSAGLAIGVETGGKRRMQVLRDLRQPCAAGRTVMNLDRPLMGEALDISSLAFIPGIDPRLSRLVAGEMLVPVFAIELARTSWRFSSEGSQIQATLERSAIDASTGRAVVNLLDLRLIEGVPREIYVAGRKFSASIALRLAALDSAQLGYRLATGSREWPRSAQGRVALNRGLTIRNSVMTIGRAASAALREQVGTLAETQEAEHVHQARVAIRRLRSVLTVFRDLLPESARRDLSGRLALLGRKLGQTRDWDVFRHTTLLPLQDALGRDARLEQIAALADHLRMRSAEALRQAVGEPEFLSLVLELGAWFDAGLWPEEPGGSSNPSLDLPFKPFARALLRRCHRKFVELGTGVSKPDPQSMHRLRIRAKKLRYTVEFMLPLFPSRRARCYLAALREIQEILGSANDAAMACSLVPLLAAPDDSSSARLAGLIAGWTAAESAAARRSFARTWQNFRMAKRPWRD